MAGGNKPNPVLAKYEAQAEARANARYKSMRDAENEISLIAYIIACDDEFELDFARAESVLNGFFDTKQEVAKAIVSDEDKQLVYTKFDLARRLRQTMGPDNWAKYKCCFPLLKDYWDSELIAN